MRKLLLINGPNLNLLGNREPEIYGRTTLPEIVEMVRARAKQMGMAVEPFQSNHEGGLIDFIQTEYDRADGIVINPGALTHYGYSLRDCLAGTGLPVVEVHITNIQKREEWRKISVLTEICVGLISGMGIEGYLMALEHFKDE